ncbi:MAG: SusC/RagA family TonB-linked outer membrane protein [Bacteroidales bacterium]|jgi:TonB-linked SusC/RagA family outer membrane protein|nr:SusC/RagA family TonB-linked outer membrane protein [Bacteroidales bacterium]
MKFNIYHKNKHNAGWLFTVTFLFASYAPVSAQNDSTTVNIAYGKQDREHTAASVAVASGEDLRKSQVSTLNNTFFGRFPGMTVIQTNGEPGYDDASIYLRGQHSMRNNSILFLLDGFEVNNINQVSPEEIESVTYLKDAVALAVYGISGANGALLVTTKRGSNTGKKVNISLKARYGIQTPTHLPKFEGSYNYARYYNEALQNDGLPLLYTDKDLEGYRTGNDPYYYPDVNWYDEILKSTSNIQDYTLSLSGGNNYSRYYVMGGFMGSDGLYDHTDGKNNSNINFQRINFRANVDIDVTKRLSVALNLGGRIEDRMFPNTATATFWQHIATYAPNLYPVRTPSGQITGTANYPDNPVGSLLYEGYGSRHTRDVQASITAREKLDFITEGLGAFASVSMNSNYMNGYNKTKTYSYYEPLRTVSSAGNDSVYYIQRGADTDLTISTGNDAEQDRMDVMAGVEYKRSFNGHDLDLLLMYRQEKYSILGEQSLYGKQNLLGRLGYTFRRKYIVEFSFSYSGTDNYEKGHRFGFFPALSLGWVVSNEHFLSGNRYIDFLKLRGSAGLLGNDKGSGRFAYNQYWGPASSQGYYFGTGVTYYEALVQLALANPHFTWEKSQLYNAGVESELFNGRLSLTADVFYENRYDIPVNVSNTLPGFSGINFSSMLNKGEANNKGLELSAMYRDRTGDFGYFAGVSYSFARNKIIKSYETPRGEEARYTQGKPIGQRFGLEAVGFFKDNTDIENSPVHTFYPVRPGDLKYKDQNGDGFIDANDEVAIRNPSVPEISYAANLGVSWKGFDVELLFDGNSNRSVYLNGYMFWPFINDYNISTWAAERRWTPENHANAAFPRLTTQSNANNYRSSDFWVRNISILRLRNAELGYNISGDLLRRLKIERVRVYLSVLNPFTFSNLDADVDPETLSVGYPVLRTYSTGIVLDF